MIAYILIVCLKAIFWLCGPYWPNPWLLPSPRVMFAAPNRISAKIAYTGRQNQMTCKYRHFLGMIFFS
jgi:hypothetical protein